MYTVQFIYLFIFCIFVYASFLLIHFRWQVDKELSPSTVLTLNMALITFDGKPVDGFGRQRRKPFIYDMNAF